MGTVVSALVYTLVDNAGNPRVECWFTLEFSGPYATDGQFFDLSPYLKYIEHAQTFSMSGDSFRTPVSASASIEIASGSRAEMVPNLADYANPVSQRFIIRGESQLSGIGMRQDILSGLAGAVSGIRFGARVLGY